MSSRGRRIFAFWLSVIGHALIVVALTFSIPLSPSPWMSPGEIVVPIDSVMIDQTALDAEMARVEAVKQAEIRAEQERVRQERQREAEALRRRNEELRLAEQRQVQLEAEAQAERERAEQAERDRLEAERQREAEAEAERQAELARQREAEALERRQNAVADEVARAVAAEQEANAARESGLLDQWRLAISSRIKSRWIEPPNMSADLQCVVDVTMIISGDVRGVKVVSCTPNEANIIRSVENAVLNASPLPPPPSRALFQPTLRITFIP